MLLRTIAPTSKGIQTKDRPHLIDPTAFLTLRQLRIKEGMVQNFPGWRSILVPKGTIVPIVVDDVLDIVNTVNTIVDLYPTSGSSQGLGGFCTAISELLTFDGAAHLFVAGPNQVFRYNPVSKTLVNISAASTFHATRDDPWWTFFFNDFLYFTNINDGLFKWDGTNQVVPVPSAPKAKLGGILASHICLFNLEGFPQRFAWAAEGVDNDWTATALNDAGGFNIDETGDVGVGMEPLANDLVLYKERTVIPITFVGGNEVFGRRTTIAGTGLLGMHAIANLVGRHIFMGNDTFYEYRGGQELDDSIGLAVRERVYPRLHPVTRGRAHALYMEPFHEVLFIYPTVDSTNDGDCNEAIVYDTQDGNWYGPFPIEASSVGSTTRAVAIVVDDVPDIVDTVTTIVDQYPGIVGGRLELFADGDPKGDIFEIGPVQDADGAEIIRVLESGDHILGQNATDEKGSPVQLPLVSVYQLNVVNLEIGDLVKLGTFQFQVGYRMELDDPVVFTPVQVISNASHQIRIPVRVTGRWFRIRITIPNSQQFGLTGYQYGFNVVGRR